MEDIEKIETALKSVARKRMEKKYEENSEGCKDIFDVRYGAEWDLSGKTELEQREHIIKTLMHDEEKRLKYHVESRFGLGKAFHLSKYSEESLENFFDFYLDYVLDEKMGVLFDTNDKKCPNQHIAQCIQKNIIKYGYEKYYDYILEYRDRLLEERNFANKFKSIQPIGAEVLGGVIRDLRTIGDNGYEPEIVWLRGLKYLECCYNGLAPKLIEQMTQAVDIDFYRNYIMGKMGLECLLVLCDQVLECRNFKKEFIADLETQFEEALKYAEKVVENKKKIIESYTEKDIFKDYAILYHVAIAERENRITYNILKSLHELTKDDVRKAWYQIMPEWDGNKYVKFTLFEERGKRYDFQRYKEKMKFADELCVALNEAMKCNYSTNQEVACVSLIEEIYNYDKDVWVECNDKTKKYNMLTLAHNLVKGKYKVYNNRNEEVILLNEKIKRGIDYRIRGKDFYLIKNKLYRSVYDLEYKIFKKRENDTEFINLLPFYWWEVVKYLLISATWSD